MELLISDFRLQIAIQSAIQSALCNLQSAISLSLLSLVDDFRVDDVASGLRAGGPGAAAASGSGRPCAGRPTTLALLPLAVHRFGGLMLCGRQLLERFIDRGGVGAFARF